MMKRLVWLAAGLLALALWVGAPAAYAAGGRPDEIVVGDDYTLAPGETLDGNLVVYGGNAVLEEGSHITGDVVIVGGNLKASGEVGGDVVMLGANTSLTATAVVGGDLVTVGGAVSQEPGAQVRGQEINTIGPSLPFGQSLYQVSVGRWLDLGSAGLALGLRALGWSVTLAVLALLVLLFWPVQTARVAAAIRAAPVATGGMGLLTAAAGAVVFSVLILALCLGLLGWLALIAAALFGWIALGSLVGARLAPALKLRDLHPAAEGALGTFGLTLGVELLRFIACLGPLVGIALASLGLGAVVLTRFGTRPYVILPPAPPAPTAPPEPPPPPEPPVPVEPTATPTVGA